MPTVEFLVHEDTVELQARHGMGLVCLFLSARRDMMMELATPSQEEPVSQIDGDVPLKSIIFWNPWTAIISPKSLCIAAVYLAVAVTLLPQET